MYFIGATDHKGTYYFYSEQHQGWITADLDTGRAKLHNKLALVRVVGEYAEVEEDLEDDSVGLGQDGERWLVDGEDLVLLLRDHEKELEVLMVYYNNGVEIPYGRTESEIAKYVKKARNKMKED